MKKKSIILMSLTLGVAMLSGHLASQARLAHRIYVYRDGDPPTICCLPISARSFIPSPFGPDLATTVQCGPCVRGTIVTLPNN